jgi:hypothetical protein
MSIMQNALGGAFTETFTAGAVRRTPPFELGTVMKGDNGTEFIYVQANGAITGPGYAVVIDRTFQATMITNANGLRGMAVGIAPVAFLDNDFGWVQVYGPCDIRVAASCAANVETTTTTTAGELDDAAGTGTKEILGLALTTARAASAGNAPGFIAYPTVYVTN